MTQNNLVAVLVSTLIYFFIGWLWYSPLMFGKIWMNTLSEEAKAMKFNPLLMVCGLGASFVTAFILASISNFSNSTTINDGLAVGFFSWLGFVAATMINNVLYEKRSFANYFINVGYYLVGFMAMGVILAIWK